MEATVRETKLGTGQTLQLVRGDIIHETTDGIVNAANRHLQHGAGVAGAIRRHGGEQIQRESDAWVRKHGPASPDTPAWTSGGNLAARVVIHAVGPVWGEGDEEAKLARAVTASLRLADELGLKSLAIPAISTGIFGFPMERAGGVILNALRAYFAENASSLERVRLVLFDEPAVRACLPAWQATFE